MRRRDLLSVINAQGYSEDEHQVHLYVDRKLRPETLKNRIKDPQSPWSVHDYIPRGSKVGLFRRKRVRVVELGIPRAQKDNRKYRPVTGGGQIMPARRARAGTGGLPCYVWCVRVWGRVVRLTGALGGFARFIKHYKGAVREPHLLTNAHVVLDDPTVDNPDHPVGQPDPQQWIGRLSYTPLMKHDHMNRVDASLIRLFRPHNDECLGTGRVSGVREPVRFETVRKYGRTTKLTSGRLIARNARLLVDYGDAGKLWVSGVDIYTRMSAKGDSGSAVVAESDDAAVGLLFGGSAKASFAFPMTRVRRLMGFEV